MEQQASAPVEKTSVLPSGVKPSRNERLNMPKRQDQSHEGTDQAKHDPAKKSVAPDHPIDQAKPVPEKPKPESESADSANQVVQTESKKTIKAVAEQLGIKPGELYDMEIPIGEGGESIKLGELKDKFKALSPNIERLESIDRLEVEHRVERGNLIRELDNLVKYLPPQALSPEYRQAAQQQMRLIAQAESEKLLQVFPEWANPVNYSAAVESMVDVAKSYGLTPAEVAGITDSRWVQALNDLAGYRKRENAAKGLKSNQQNPAGQIPAKNSAPSIPPGKRKGATGKTSGDRVSQQAAVANLLRSLE